MRVLFVTHSYPRFPGDAAGSFLWHLAVALRAQGVEVRVVAPSADALPSQDVFDGIVVDRFRYAPRRFENLAYTGNMASEVQRSWSARLALLGFLGSEFAFATRIRREFDPDIVHAHWWFPGGLAAMWVAGLGHVPMVTTMHGTDVRLARAKTFAQPLFRHVLKHSAAVTTVSRWLADETRAIAPEIDPVVAPMPVAVDLFAPGSDRVEGQALFVGRLNAQKGIADLLDAVARAPSVRRLQVVGDGPDRDDLRGRAAALGIADRVEWLGALPQPELVQRYQQASVLVVPSVNEGLGLVAAEGQLCETPVIAYDSGGLRDLIRDGETGRLVPPGDIGALATSIESVLTNSGRAAELGRAGRMNALAQFAPESAARRYVQVYEGVRKR